MSRSVTPNGNIDKSSLTILPQEVLEQVFLCLSLTDRLTLSRIYQSSPPLQYDFTLRTSSYLDVLNEPPEVNRPKIEDVTEDSSRGAPMPITRLKSPHTDKVRKTIPSVTLAPWPRIAPPVRKTAFLSPLEKHKLLKEREERWDKLDAAQVRTFRVFGRAGVYELQEGIFLVCDEWSGSEDEKPWSIRLIPLPSAIDPDLDNPIVQTSSHKLPFPISDLTMDPTQDLIVVSEFRPAPIDSNHQAPTHRFHLLTLSTFKPHPLASLPRLDFPPFTSVITETRQLLQVMGDTLLVLVSRYAAHWVLAGLGIPVAGFGGVGNDEEIVAWNWKTGQVLCRLGLPENGWFSSFVTLSPTTFMVTTTSNISPVLPDETRHIASVFPPVIQIYSFAPDPSNHIVPVQPLSAEPFDDTTARPVLIAQLNLPTFVPGQMISSFDIRPDPAFPPIPKGAYTLGERKPFTQNPNNGVIVFDISVTEPPEPVFDVERGLEGQSFEMFVLRETMIDIAVEGEERLRRSRLPVGDPDKLEVWDVTQVLKWEEWGIENARMLDVTMPRRLWVCSCSGYRFASLVNPLTDHHDPPQPPPRMVEPSGRHDLQVLDFSPISVRRAQSRPAPEADEGLRVRVVDEPTVLSYKSVWKEDVKSTLEYVEITREMGMVCNGVMIDDQRVIIVKAEGLEIWMH